MATKLHIAILVADAVIQAYEDQGGYVKLYSELSHRGADRYAEQHGGQRPELEFSVYNVWDKMQFPASLDGIDCVLISGSRYNSFDDTPWILALVEFTNRVLASDTTSLIGVCFGHQIIARALGCKVGLNPLGAKGQELSVLPMTLTERGKAVFGQQDLSINQVHQDVVYELPSGAESLGSTRLCEIQGLYRRNVYISVQGHPEMQKDFIAALVNMRHDKGLYADEVYEDAMRRVADPQDGDVVARAFINFALEAKAAREA